MVHVSTPRPNIGAALGQALTQVLGPRLEQQYQMQLQQHQQRQQQSMLDQALTQAQKVYADPNLSPEQKQIGLFQVLSGRPEIAQALGKQLQQQQALQQKINTPKAPLGGLTGQPTPPEVGQAIESVIGSNPNANSDQLAIQLDKAGIPRAFSNPFIENRRREQERESARLATETSQLRKETLPIRQEISSKGEASRTGIENKEKLLKIIDSGNLDDPTFAAIAEAMPFNLGKRLLSPETAEYKSALIDEFTDLRKLFQGQTRVKEIELLENKLADLYLTDDQKKRILKSRIDALKKDLIIEDAAADVEKDMPNLGALSFRKEVNKRAKPKLEGLFHQILDEQKSVIKDAENRKKVPLDINDPTDREIAEQILKEAGGDSKKAQQLAKKRGYVF